MSSLLLETQREARVEEHDSSQCLMLLEVILILDAIVSKVRLHGDILFQCRSYTCPGRPCLHNQCPESLRSSEEGIYSVQAASGHDRFHLKPWETPTPYFQHSGGGEVMLHFDCPVPGWCS